MIGTFQTISLFDWCRPVSRARFDRLDRNTVLTMNDADFVEPVLTHPGLRAVPGFERLDPIDRDTAGRYGTRYRPEQDRIAPAGPSFVAALRAAEIEFPGMGVFVHRDLLLEETYHDARMTEESGRWFGDRGNRKSVTVNLGDGSHPPEPVLIRYRRAGGPAQRYDGTCVLLSGPSAYNYAHWLVEMLPRLWVFDAVPGLKDLPLLVRAPLLPFQRETLEAMGATKVVPFSGEWVEVEQLIFPSYLAPGNNSIRNVDWLRRKLMPAFRLGKSRPRNLVYVSRSGAGQRRVLNEDELVDKLNQRGFQILRTEKMTVREQVKAFRDARLVIIPHGAAIQNVVFCSPGTVVLELIPASYQHPAGYIYGSLSKLWFGRLICDDSASVKERHYSVDVPTFLEIVDRAADFAGSAASRAGPA